MDKYRLTEFQNWTRPLIGQPDALTPNYISEEIRDNALREFALREHEEAISLWLVALNLLAFAFEPGRVYTAPGTEPNSAEDTPEARIGRAAYMLRLQLIGLSGRASKPALDLTLSGYYTEAWTLLRTMLDGWARSVYVRLRPKGHVRWYASENEGSHKEPPHWGEIEGAIGKDGNEEDKALFAEALLRWELLQVGSHPSGEGIGQTRDDELGILTYRPEYHKGFCTHTFSLGVLVQRALLRELELMGSHEDWWLKTNAKFASDVQSLENSMRPALDAMAAKIQGRRTRTKPIVAQLTPRERELLQLLAEGLDDATIAERLYLTQGTVRNHMTHLLEKLEVDSRLQALVLAARYGLVTIE
jgi:DNA-binding CsgD family transcriptional regulator